MSKTSKITIRTVLSLVRRMTIEKKKLIYLLKSRNSLRKGRQQNEECKNPVLNLVLIQWRMMKGEVIDSNKVV